MLFVFDTNIWISSLGLNSSIGSAVRYFIKNNNATVVVPEVIKLEVIENSHSMISKFVSNIDKNHRQLLAMFGSLKEMVLPGDDDIMAKANSIIDSSGMEIREIPFNLEVAYSSFHKLIKKLPPSDQGQQFKDGVIWQHCVDMLDEDDVYLVTNDKAFYENKDFSSGLASSLKADIAGKHNALYIYHELTALIKDIEIVVEVDQAKLLDEIKNSGGETFYSILERNGFKVDSNPQIKITSFITEDTDLVFIEYEALFDCTDLTDKNRQNAFLSIKGDASYHPSNSEFSDFRNFGECLSFVDEIGNRQENQNQVIHIGTAVMGHREVKHGVRYKLN